MDIETDDKCMFCLKEPSSEKEKRFVTINNYHQLGLTNNEYTQQGNKRVCSACRLLKGIPKYRKKCAVLTCNTPRKKLKLRQLNLNDSNKHVIQEKFGVHEGDNVCQACLYKINKYIKNDRIENDGTRNYTDQQHKSPPQARNKEDMNASGMGTSSNIVTQQHETPPQARNKEETTTSAPKAKIDHGGRPRKKYSEGSASTKRKIKSKAKNLLSELVSKYDEISKGEGQDLLTDVCDKIPISNKPDTRLFEVVNGLARAYEKEPSGPAGKTRILSTVANSFSNKELKEKFRCNDYQIMQARRQATEYGPGVTPPKSKKFVTKYKVPFKDIVFLLNFIHHPDNTEPSSHRMASCDGKKSSWISDLIGEGKQPVLWLKDGKHHLYEKYKQQCSKQGTKPISETKFLKGLNAGNFKEMVEMAGLCNICDEVGARNFESFNTLLSNIEEEVASFQTSRTDDNNPENISENSCTAYNVTMVDLPPHEDDRQQVNPLPNDSPVFMVETHSGVYNDTLSVKGIRKRIKAFRGHLLSDFQNLLSITSNSPCHCMTWLLEENAKCKGHSEMCSKCFERYLLFQDVAMFVNNTCLPKERKTYYQNLLGNIEIKTQKYIAHLVRGKYQRQQFLTVINESSPGHAIVVCDYMMKLLLQKFREPQKDWYAKKGVSVHGCMFFFRCGTSSDIQIEIHDLFSNGDCTQNCFFSASALEASFKNFQARRPEVNVLSIWTSLP